MRGTDKIHVNETSTNDIARVATCTKHLSKAMRFLNVTINQTRTIKSTRVSHDSHFRCECGQDAAYYLRLVADR